MIEENELDSTSGISNEELTERFKASIRIDMEICKIKDYLLLVMMGCFYLHHVTHHPMIWF